MGQLIWFCLENQALLKQYKESLSKKFDINSGRLLNVDIMQIPFILIWNKIRWVYPMVKVLHTAAYLLVISVSKKYSSSCYLLWCERVSSRSKFYLFNLAKLGGWSSTTNKLHQLVWYNVNDNVDYRRGWLYYYYRWEGPKIQYLSLQIENLWL